MRSDEKLILCWVYFGFLILNCNRTVRTEPHCYSTTLPHSPRRKWGNCARRGFCTQNNPVLPLSVSRTFSLRHIHPVAPYVLFFVFMSLPSFLQQRHLEDSSYPTCDHCSHPSFVALHVEYSFPFWLCSTSFLTWYNHLISIHLQDHISKLYPKYQKKFNSPNQLDCKTQRAQSPSTDESYRADYRHHKLIADRLIN